MRVVNVKLLPDGSGRIRVHYFAWGPGPVETPTAVAMAGITPVRLGGSVDGQHRRGFIACQPGRAGILPDSRGDGVHLVPHSDDPRAANCPECMATEAFKEHMARLKETVPVTA